MRVTMNTLYDQINTDLSRLVEKQAKTNSSISSGKIYRMPSDAPVKLTHALEVRGTLSEIDQYKRNISYGKGWAKATETALRQITDRLGRAKELAVEGANDIQNSNDRKAIASEVKAIRDEIVALANTKMGNRYVLAGSKTTGYRPGQRPFSLDRDGHVTYLGNQEDFSVDVASGQQLKINIDGQTALVQSGIFETLDQLYDALKADSRPDIEIALGDLDKVITHISDQSAVLGAIQNDLDNRDDITDTLGLTDKTLLSSIEDTDIIKAISDLKALDTGYKAALASASRVMNLSLVDFL